MAQEKFEDIMRDHESRISLLERLYERLEVHLQKHVNRHFIMTVWIGTQTVFIIGLLVAFIVQLVSQGSMEELLIEYLRKGGASGF